VEIHTAGCDEQIWKAVIVQIHNSRAPADVSGFNSQASANGHIVKIALAVIAVKNISIVGEIGLEDIQVAVQVIVANPNSHACLLHAVLTKSNPALKGLFPKRSEEHTSELQSPDH